MEGGEGMHLEMRMGRPMVVALLPVALAGSWSSGGARRSNGGASRRGGEPARQQVPPGWTGTVGGTRTAVWMTGVDMGGGGERDTLMARYVAAAITAARWRRRRRGAARGAAAAMAAVECWDCTWGAPRHKRIRQLKLEPRAHRTTSLSPCLNTSLSPSLNTSINTSLSPSLNTNLSPSLNTSLSPSLSPSLHLSLGFRRSLPPCVSPSRVPSLVTPHWPAEHHMAVEEEEEEEEEDHGLRTW